jgi:hypothetical protein
VEFTRQHDFQPASWLVIVETSDQPASWLVKKRLRAAALQSFAPNTDSGRLKEERE